MEEHVNSDSNNNSHSEHHKLAVHDSSGWYKATFFRRLTALIIDLCIISGISAVMYIGLAAINQLNLHFYFLSIFNILYFVLFIWKKGATLGKSAMKIKVVRTNGENLSLIQAILREVIGKFISELALGLGYFWALWDENRQTWHDKIAGTYVVTKIPNDGKKSGCLIAIAIGAVLIVPIMIIILLAGYMVWLRGKYAASLLPIPSPSSQSVIATPNAAP